MAFVARPAQVSFLNTETVTGGLKVGSRSLNPKQLSTAFTQQESCKRISMPKEMPIKMPSGASSVNESISITDPSMLHALSHVLPAIASLGYEAFLVGGCVRDTLQRRAVNDVDIVTDCPSHLLTKHFTIRADISKNMDITVHLLQSAGYSFETAQLRGKDDTCPLPPQPPADSQGMTIINNALPPKLPCLSPTLKNDLERRDFTINALALDSRGNLIDPYGGYEDIAHKRIRAVVDADKRISEDPLRILRAIRFGQQYGFQLEASTAKALQRHAKELTSVAQERIQQELEKIARLGGAAFSKAMDSMFKLGILKVILPEIARLNDFEHAPEHHPEGNVFSHTLACLEECESSSPEILFAILCHDMGKTQTFMEKNGKPSYPAHDKAALPLIQSMAKRLRWSNKLVAHVVFSAQHHMRFHAIPLMAPHKTFALMESPYFTTLYTTALCDARARKNAFDPVAWEAIENRLVSLRTMFLGENSPFRLLEGKRVMSATGLSSGPLIGAIINKTKTWMLDNSITDQQSIDQRLRQLAKSMR